MNLPEPGVPPPKIRHPRVIDARERAHAAFDQLWKSGSMTRDAAYAWLRGAMKLPPREAHIGKMHIEQCDKVVRLVRERLDKVHIPSTGNTFSKVRAIVAELEPILKTELLRTLLEDADHTMLNALTANGRAVLLARELDDARAALDEMRTEALEDLTALRREIQTDQVERGILRHRTQKLEERLEALLAEIGG